MMLITDRSHHRGFTLVELMIVVAILGILAAIVIPKVSSATDNARSNGAYSQLVSVRKQLEVWKMEHNDLYPTLAQLQEGVSDWDVFVNKTTTNGTLSALGKQGPYFPTPPSNPYTNSSLVVTTGEPVSTAGWTYDESTGQLRLIVPTAVDISLTELHAADVEQP